MSKQIKVRPKPTLEAGDLAKKRGWGKEKDLSVLGATIGTMGWVCPSGPIICQWSLG